MSIHKLSDFLKIKWLADSDIGKTFIEGRDLSDEDEEIVLPEYVKLIPDILTDESIGDLFRTMYYVCNSRPSNFLDHLRTRPVHEFDTLLKEFKTRYENLEIEKFTDFRELRPAKICRWASENGYVDILEYGIEKGFFCNQDSFHLAAFNGHLECLVILHRNGCDLNIRTFDRAIEADQLECLKFLLTIKDFDSLIERSIEYGSIKCFKYFLSTRKETVSLLEFENIIEYERINFLSYLLDEGYEINHDGYSVTMAVTHDSYRCMVWLHEHGCTLTLESSSEAAVKEDVKYLKYLHEHGCYWDETTLIEDVSLDCLEYAHENGCPINNNVIISAIKDRRIDCLDYLLGSGFPITEELFLEAVHEGNIKSLECFVKHCCPLYEVEIDDMLPEYIDFLIKNKFPLKYSHK